MGFYVFSLELLFLFIYYLSSIKSISSSSSIRVFSKLFYSIYINLMFFSFSLNESYI